VLQLAITVDANEHALILAWGIVDGESEVTWSWFLSYLITAIPGTRGRTMPRVPGQLRPLYDHSALVGDTTMISDRDKGLLGALGALAPGVNQAFCTRHLEQNFLDPKNGGSRGLLQWFRRIGKAKTPGAFHVLVDELAKEAPNAADYLRRIPPEYWVLGAFPGSRWGIATSNHAESTNAALMHPRGQPITHLLYAIWGYVKAHRWQYSEKAR
jgi:hypothetical protein